MSAVTVFWFGAEAYCLYKSSELASIPLPDKGDPAAAIAAHITALDPKPKSAQIVYQPAGLDPLSASCQRGPRADLAKTLAGEFPAIANASTTWATLTPQPYEGAYRTLLFLETKPRLPRIAAALAEEGIALRGAWPLPALLETLPGFASADAPGIFFVTTPTTAFVYALLPNASRTVTLVNDISAPQSSLLALNTALTYFDRDVPPPVHVVSFGDPWPLGESFAELTPTSHALQDILARADSLPTRGTSNFIPPDVTLPWNRIVQAAALFLFLYAIVTTFIYYRDFRALQADQSRRAAIAEDLRAQVAMLRQNRDQIQTDEAFSGELPPSQRPIARLIDTLVKATPTAITLHTLSVTDGTFTIEGSLHEGTGGTKGPFTDFYNALGRPDLPWTLAAHNRTAATADFVLSGTFKGL
jgi:hypothetical protein